MSRSPQRLLPVVSLALLIGSAALPAMAGSAASSESSGSGSTSVGSLSTSVGKSSESSSSKDKNVADGDYRVVEVAAADASGKLRVKLQAAGDESVDGELFLTLPQGAVARGRLTTGAVISAKRRVYGIEFADGATREPFFLVMRDDWFRELDSKPVVL